MKNLKNNIFKAVLILSIFISSGFAKDYIYNGKKISLRASKNDITHLVFDEVIKESIYPKEKPVSVLIRKKHIYFKYNPFKKYKIKGDVKEEDGYEYRPVRISIFFIGESGENYEIEFIPRVRGSITHHITTNIINQEVSQESNYKEDERGKLLNSISNLLINGSDKNYFKSDIQKEITINNQKLTSSSSFEGMYKIYIFDNYSSISYADLTNALNTPTYKPKFIGMYGNKFIVVEE